MFSTVTGTKNVQKIMLEDTGKSFELIQQCDTRWYSHYKMILSLFRAREYLGKYKSLVRNNDPIIQKHIGRNALDTIGSTNYWLKLELASTVLRKITIEIGVAEIRKSSSSDAIQSFRRAWAFLHNIKIQASERFSSLN